MEDIELIDTDTAKKYHSDCDAESSSSSSSSGSSSSNLYNSSEDFHHDHSEQSLTPRSSSSEEEEDLAPPKMIKAPQEEEDLTFTPQNFLKIAWDFKEQGNMYFKKKQYRQAIACYRRVELYTRAVKQPDLPDLQIAKTEKELKKEEEKKKQAVKEGKASADPRDPRFKDLETPKSMEELNEMSKWMMIPQMWKELPQSKSPLIFNADKTDERVLKEIQSSTYLNMSICFHNLKKYQRSIECAGASCALNPSVKAFFRKAISHKTKGEYSLAIEALKEALQIARALVKENECQDVLKEMAVLEKLEKAKEKKRMEKLKGFLTK